MLLTFVLSLPSFNFFTAKGRVKIIKSRVSKTKISNCHLKGSPVFAIKINGRLLNAAQIVVSDIVNASMTTNTTSIINQNHGKFDNIKFVMVLLYYGFFENISFFLFFFIKRIFSDFFFTWEEFFSNDV